MARAGLTHERVVAEAAAVADDVGLERLTLAAVAERFGVALPSLYKHVDGLDGLRRDLAILGVEELTVVLSKAAVGKSRHDALRGFADAYRAYAHAKPGRYTAAMKAPEPDDDAHNKAAAEVLALLFALIEGYGITGTDAVDAARTLRAALHGFMSLEQLGGTKMPRDATVSYHRMVDALDEVFANWTAARTSKKRKKKK